jgi:hypothetical protein
MAAMPLRLTTLLLFTFFRFYLYGQDSITTNLQQIPSKYLDKVSSSANELQEKLNKKEEKALQQTMKLEARMRKKLQRIDSLAANNIFTDADKKYNELEQKLTNPKSLTQYIPFLDTIHSSLKFLKQNQQFLSQAKDEEQKIKEALIKVKGLEDQFQKAEEIRKFLKERKQFLKEQLEKFGFTKELKKLNKQVYYYSEQIKEYKTILQNPNKIERKAIELLAKTKFFQDFMRKNSMLASLFRMPGGDLNDPAYQASLAGLQTRTQVNNLIQQQIGAGGPNAQAQFQQNMQQAQSQILQLKNKVSKFGGGSSDDIMPEGFRKNDQKTKSFLKRLEYGTNVQTQRATSFFPVTSDIGLSLGYKLNDKSVIGIGASYKMGWGRGWNNIRITNQGIGLRSYADIKLKKSLWISAGYEQNYKTAFSDFSQLRDKNAWQQSGLIGVSKVISVKTKFFKKTKLQLLWDFLSTKQMPRTQPVIFRIGYNF